jgi:hypothetical protein
MKYLLASLLFLALLSFDTKTLRMDIQSATNDGFIKVKSSSTGQVYGNTVSCEITRLKKGTFILSIPAGTVFKSNDAEDQDMLVMENQDFVVQNDQSTITVRGYCCQASNSAPEPQGAMTLAVHPNAELQKLANYTSNRKLPEDMIQEAVWAVADNHSVSRISEEQVEVVALRKKVCEIKGIEDSPFHNKGKISIDEDRQVRRNSVSVTGNCKYTVQEKGYVDFVVRSENGQEKMRMRGKSQITQLGEYNFRFGATVEGWKQGKYKLQVVINEKVINEMEFEV